MVFGEDNHICVFSYMIVILYILFVLVEMYDTMAAMLELSKSWMHADKAFTFGGHLETHAFVSKLVYYFSNCSN